MVDTTFRTATEEQPKEEKTQEVKVKDPIAIPEDTIEPPYLDYQEVKGKPFLVEYFNIGELWQEKLGGFENEISSIETHIENKIRYGNVENSVKAVKKLIKDIERVCGAKDIDRLTIKLGKMSAYTEFLNKTENIDKYGYAS